MSKPVFSRAVHIIDGARTPFLKAASGAGPFSAADLAVNTSRELLLRQTFKPSDFDEVVFGCVMPSPKETRETETRLEHQRKVDAAAFAAVAAAAHAEQTSNS